VRGAVSFWAGGGCSGTCTTTIAAATTVSATFTLQQFPVTVTADCTGAGTVTSAPAGIDCGATCTANCDFGTVVTLAAAPNAGSVFAGWSGAGCSGAGNCAFTVTGTTTITASYRGARVAISAGATSCLRTAGNSGDRARILIGNRGHVATFVAAIDIDTPAEIAAYDVIVIGGPGNPCASIDASGYDGIIDNYVSVTGATSLLAVALNSVGASWTVGNGRTVFLGPMYLEDYATYANEDLLDGTQAASIELFLRAIEWAAKAR